MTQSTTKRSTGETSYKETSQGIIPRSRLVVLELKGLEKGINFLLSLTNSNKSTKITPSQILDLHKESFGWIFPDWAGKFRTLQVEYSGKEAPPYFQIPQLITDLCLDLEEQIRNLPSTNNEDFLEKLAELLSWFQYRFVFIHPFNDYNGRTARMMTTLICLNLGMPPIEIIVAPGVGRKRYIQSMKEADKGDLTKLKVLIYQALVESIEKIKV